MLLQKQSLQYVNSIAHAGKVVLFGIDTQGKIWYTVKQDGFEDSYLNAPPDQRTGWETWKELDLPNEAKADASVIEREAKEFTYSDNSSNWLLRSRYKTKTETAVAPIQLVSGTKHLYVFRQSKQNTLLCDRYVLDGMANALIRKLQVRFKRSGQRFKPHESSKTAGNLQTDSLDYRDANGKSFYEPTTELSFIRNLKSGWFSVVQLPTIEHDKHRWHIFAYDNELKQLNLYSLRVSDEGLFDVYDYNILQPKSEDDPTLIPHSIPGIIKRTLDLNVQVGNGISATKYFVQTSTKTDSGEELLMRAATRVMLTMVTTDNKVAAISFVALNDGTLAQIDEVPDTKILRSNPREVLLPVNTLDNIRAIGLAEPPPEGTISGFNRKITDGIPHVQVTSADAAALKNGQEIIIEGSSAYDGHYHVTKIDQATFEIDTPWVGNGSANSDDPELGTWQVVPPEKQAITFDGIITGYEITPEGKLRVTAENHRLEHGDEVQIFDTTSYDGVYPIAKLDDQNFVINKLRWQTGEAVSLKARSLKRRGIIFDGDNDYIQISDYKGISGANDRTVEAWIKTTESNIAIVSWGSQTSSQKWAFSVSSLGENVGVIQVEIIDGHISGSTKVNDGTWHHVACTFVQGDNVDTTKVNLYVDGKLETISNNTSIEVNTPVYNIDVTPVYNVDVTNVNLHVDDNLETISNNTPEEAQTAAEHGVYIGRDIAAADRDCQGQIADVRIWKVARTAAEIKNSMYLQLTGREVNLVGYWRLGGIAIGEDNQREVVDFSVSGNDGLVYGECYVSEVTLNRTLGDGSTPVVTYQNDEVFAVTQRATYLETFEFRVSPTINPLDIDGDGTQLFQCSYWGKKSHRSEEKIDFTGEHTQIEIVPGNIQGWYSASCRFTVPDEVNLVRCFEIAEVSGAWDTLEVRKQRIQKISDTITEAEYQDAVALEPLGTPELYSYTSSIAETEQLTQRQLTERLQHKELEEASLIQRLDILNKYKTIQELIKQQQAKVGKLKSDEAYARKKYDEHRNNIFNYWCRISSRNDKNGSLRNYAKDKNLINTPSSEGGYQGWGNQQFKFDHVGGVLGADGNNRFTISDSYYSKYVEFHSGHRVVINNANVKDVRNLNNSQYHWRFKLRDDGYYTIENFGRGKYLTLHGINVELFGEDSHANRHWRITSLGIASNQRIQNAKAAWEILDKELGNAQERLDDLNAQAKANLNPAIEIPIVEGLLQQVQNDIRLLNEIVISSTQKLPELKMPVIATQNDFSTTGAILDSIRPASRITSLETVEGMVQVSYLDQQGKIRQGVFDATADQKNIHFEEWLTNHHPVCLNCSQGSQRINLGASGQEATLISEGSDWTIEANFVYPFPKTAQWNTLIDSPQGNRHILVKLVNERKCLGTEVDGQFYYCLPDSTLTSDADNGYDMSNLSIGWHQLTVVGTTVTEDNVAQEKTIFYLDGVKVGECLVKNEGDISQIGNVAAAGQAFGKLSEIRIWNIALDEAEVLSHSQVYLTGDEPGLVAYYRLDEGAGTEVRDTTENGKNGTIYGAEWWGCTRELDNVIANTFECYLLNFLHIKGYKGIIRSDSRTVEAWICTTKSDSVIVSWGQEANGQKWSFGIQPSGVISVDVGAGYVAGSTVVSDGLWHHVACTFQNNGSADVTNVKLYVDGKPDTIGDSDSQLINTGNAADICIGEGFWTDSIEELFDTGADTFIGKIADIRIWNVARSAQEIKENRDQRLTGEESGLTAYLPLNEADIEDRWRTANLADNNRPGQITSVSSTLDTRRLFKQAIPHIVHKTDGKAVISSWLLSRKVPRVKMDDMVTSVEYNTFEIDTVARKKSSMMRRLFAYPTSDGLQLLMDKRIENLELLWIGNAQFEPTLLGYIEGAPPVPSENMNIDGDYQYNGATSVALTTSEDVEYSWTRTQEAGLGGSFDLFLGVNDEVKAGASVGKTVVKNAIEFRGGLHGTLDFSYQWFNESNVTSNSSLVSTDYLELRGAPEVTAKFPHYGPRFIPKNVGYALVVSSLADVFVTRLARTKKMVSYQILPVEDIPPDVNTITFLINPAYVMNGSLDGLVGSSAADDRFYGHVPEMRAQYGSLYPASYFRLKEAYGLKSAIAKADKERQSYFDNFNSNLVDEWSLESEAGKKSSVSTISIGEDFNTGKDLTEEQQEQQLEEMQEQGEAELEDLEKQGEQKKKEINSRISDAKKRNQAISSFATWQKTMENILVQSGKRNIVNTYVWDADGGLRSEEQSFANTTEHTIGGSFTLDGGLGMDMKMFVGGPGGELTALATANLTQTMTKTQANSTGMELNVDLSGIETLGITDANDIPFQPGEKVDRFRMMSFYLEGSTDNYHDFFQYVVDPEWLASNDEEARALRQVQAGKANKTWRVLHRVTYVERPALNGFGRDARSLAETATYANALTSWLVPANATVLNEVKAVRDRMDYLERENEKLQEKIDQILNWVNSQ